MNLMYKVDEKGYTIFDNGVAWIRQEDYIPYPGATMEESAQNHINKMLEDSEKEVQEANKVQSLEDRLTLTEEMLMEMMLNGGAE